MMPPPMMTISAWEGSLLMRVENSARVEARGMLAAAARACKPQGDRRRGRESAPSPAPRALRPGGREREKKLDPGFRGRTPCPPASGPLPPGQTGVDVVDAGHDVGDAVDDVMGARLGEALMGRGTAWGALGLG